VGDHSSLPWDVVDTAERLSKVFAIPKDAMADALVSNARRVLEFAGLS
jgi:hypothetical protein